MSSAQEPETVNQAAAATPPAAVELQPVRIELLELPADPAGQEENGPGSHYDRCVVPIAAAGQAVARTNDPARTVLGPNVAWGPDGFTVVATANGQVRVHESRVWVDDILGIPGDVDFNTGNLEYDRDICIRGSVQDLFKVTSRGTIRVMRDIEAAEVRAAMDLLVAGGISGKEKGHCFAGHDVKARYIRNSTVEAGNDVIAVNEISHSRVICGGRVHVDRGSIMAGHVTAAGGVTCDSLGCSSDTQTVIEAGIDEALRRLAAKDAPKIDADIRQIEKIRETVEPLLRHQKGLTAEQKEKATELLYNASELEERHQETIALLRRSHADAAARGKEEIVVNGHVHDGVIVHFRGVEAAVPPGIRGPLRIVPRAAGGERQIVVTHRGSTSGFGLETHQHADPILDALDRILTTKPQAAAA
ncbi:MAG: FapA family protein [Tepidisphaerales bacterium]